MLDLPRTAAGELPARRTSRRRETRSTLIDMLVIAVLTAAAYVGATSIDLFEHMVEWSHRFEALELDELIAPVVLLPFALAVFSLRRWRELRRALEARERAEQRLEDAARLEGVVLAARTMQHEINNHLSITVGYTEILTSDTTLSPEQRQMASDALQGAVSAVALLTRLRLLTRLDVHYVGASDGPILELSGREATSLPTSGS